MRSNSVEHHRKELCRNGYPYHQRHVVVVEISCDPASKEPGYAEPCLEYAEPGGPHGLRNDLSDGGLHDTLLSAHAYPPQDDASGDESRIFRGKDEHREQRGQRRGDHEALEPGLVEEPAEEKSCDRVHSHGKRIQKAQRIQWKRPAPGALQCDNREIDESEGEEADRHHVENKVIPEHELLSCVGRLVEFFRMRVLVSGKQYQKHRDDPWYAQEKKGYPAGVQAAVSRVDTAYHKQYHRSEESAQLVQKLLPRKAHALADLRRGEADQSIFCRLFYSFSHSLHHDQTAGDDPPLVRHESKGRYGHDLDSVSQDDHGPVLLRSVCDHSRCDPEAVSEELTEAGNETDGGTRSACQAQVLAEDAPCSLVGHV